MNRQSGEPAMVGSSIALLQERFRQLQRVKERRKEQQLVRVGSDSEHEASVPAKLEMAFPLRPVTNQDSFSLGFSRAGAVANDFSLRNNVNMGNKANSFDSSDVDTSLHL